MGRGALKEKEKKLLSLHKKNGEEEGERSVSHCREKI